jgi:carbonic anhydrase
MQKLVQGIHQFQNHIFSSQRDLFARLANGQSPETLFITCSDSRINPNLLTQTEPGDLFILRNAGNIIPPFGAVLGAASATIEYAMEALDNPHIIVCGHSDCGAMKGLLKRDLAERMPTVAGWLRFADVPRQMVLRDPNLTDAERLDALVRENVLAQLAHLKTHPAVAVRLARGEVQLHGWVYDIETAEIRAFDAERGAFLPLEFEPTPQATPALRATPEVRA